MILSKFFFEPKKLINPIASLTLSKNPPNGLNPFSDFSFLSPKIFETEFVLLKLLADNELIKDPKLFFFGEIFALSNPTILFFAPESTDDPIGDPPEIKFSADSLLAFFEPIIFFGFIPLNSAKGSPFSFSILAE